MHLLMGRVFTNGPGGQGSIRGRIILKTQKIVLDVSLLNTLHYKIGIKGEVEKRGKELCPPLHLGVVAIEKGALWSPATKGRQIYLCTEKIFFF